MWVRGKCVTLQRFRRETGRLAQLVQSVCLTSRGSGVRIPQRPPPRFSRRDANTDTSGRGPVAIELSCRQHIFGALSSAGSERLPYKQRVGGSNPSAPTTDTLGDTSKVSEVFFVPDRSIRTSASLRTAQTTKPRALSRIYTYHI